MKYSQNIYDCGFDSLNRYAANLYGINYALSGVIYSVYGVNYTSSVINYNSLGVNYSIYGINYTLSVINYNLSGINYNVYGVNYASSVINYNISLVNFNLSVINFDLSEINFTLRGIKFNKSILKTEVKMINSDWMPSKRGKQMEMAKVWALLIAQKQEAWKVPEEAATKLSSVIDVADKENRVPDNKRNKISTIRLKTAFKELVAVMRDIKKRYFYNPPLTNADIISLGLKPRDNTPTAVPAPTGQATANVIYLGHLQLQLRIHHVENKSIDPQANYGYRIYYGVYADSDTPPDNGTDLRESKFTRKKKVLFTFSPTEAKKTAYFCIRYENSKGEAGVWGSLFSAIIP